jgi:flagellar hook-basal body complex protein FliE
MAVAPIGSVGSLGSLAHVNGAPRVAGTNPAEAPAAGKDIGSAFAGALDSLQAMQTKTDTLATQAATGDLKDVSQYTVSAAETSLATELTVAIRDKAVESFNEIMRMQI